jgi:succinate dehydrogenase / fumarate reductase, iron-sulfur subunit
VNLTLRVWRQAGPDAPGRFETYEATDVSEDSSFLELLDHVNEELIAAGEVPIEFAHDCREGICGTCGVMINGQAHGPQLGTATCQLHLRQFEDGDELVIEPWRTSGFPIIRDLVVDRTAFDRIVEAGGYISVDTGSAPDANLVPVPVDDAELAMDAAACIACGACVAACPAWTAACVACAPACVAACTARSRFTVSISCRRSDSPLVMSVPPSSIYLSGSSTITHYELI